MQRTVLARSPQPGILSPSAPWHIACFTIDVHPIFHSFKRLYWSSMRFARSWADEYGITPARLDALIIIAQGDGGVSQGDIHRRLDVTAPVITRMLGSLEELGLVERRGHNKDRRKRWVTVTERGRALLRLAVLELLYDGFTERCLRILVAPHATRARDADRAMRHARAWSLQQRRYLRDRSTHRYPCYLANGERSPDFPLGASGVVPPARRLAA